MDRLEIQLAQLENAQLVRPVPDLELTYLFKHALTQETAYESLLIKTRRHIHRRVAEAIERIESDRLDENAAFLAKHYDEAGDEAKTLAYSVRAGDMAARVYAYAEAITHYRRAVAAIHAGTSATSDLIIHLYAGLGRAYELNGHYDLSLSSAEEMESYARKQADRVVEMASLLQRALIYAVHSPLHNSQRGLELAERALTLSRELKDPAAEAKALWIESLAYLWSGSPFDAIEFGEAAVRVARQFNLREQLAYSLSDLGYAYSYTGNPSQAIASRQEADELWHELDNRAMRGDNLTGLGLVLLTSGSIEQGRTAIQQAMELNRSIGNHWGEAYALSCEGHAYTLQGEMDRAINILRSAVDLANETGAIGPLIVAHGGLADIYLFLGALEPAMEHAGLATQNAREHLPEWLAWCYSLQIRALLLERNIAGATTLAREAAFEPLEQYMKKVWAKGALWVARGRGEMALAQNNISLAIEIGNTIVHYFRSTGATTYIPEALHFQANALIHAGRDDEACAMLREAVTLAESMELHPNLFELLALLSKAESARGQDNAAEQHRSAMQRQADWIAAHTPPELRDSFLEWARSIFDVI